jgi:hypothetical protein
LSSDAKFKLGSQISLMLSNRKIKTALSLIVNQGAADLGLILGREPIFLYSSSQRQRTVLLFN